MSEDGPKPDTETKKYFVNNDFTWVLATKDRPNQEDTTNVHRYIGTLGQMEIPKFPGQTRLDYVWCKIVIPGYDSSKWRCDLFFREPDDADYSHEDWNVSEVYNMPTYVSYMQLNFRKRTMEQITEEEIAQFKNAYISLSDKQDGPFS